MKSNQKLERYLSQVNRRPLYQKNSRLRWLIRWVLEDFTANYANPVSYERGLHAQGLQDGTVRARVIIARRYVRWEKKEGLSLGFLVPPAVIAQQVRSLHRFHKAAAR
jgi:hypothetical protein